MIMRLLLASITLTALLQQIAAEDIIQKLGDQGSEDQSITFSIKENKALESKELDDDFDDISELSQRCLGCDLCKDYDDGMDENGKGNRVCSTDAGELDGCVSMFMSGLIRKCVSDMNMDDISYCNKNEDLCIKCYAPDCNVHNFTAYLDLPGGKSTPIRTSFWLLSTCLISWLVMSE